MLDKTLQILNSNKNLKLAILFRPINSNQKKELISKLGDSLGLPIDLIDLSQAGEPLLGEILKGKTIYDCSNEKAKLLSKHPLNTSDFEPLQQRILRERREQWINE